VEHIIDDGKPGALVLPDDEGKQDKSW